MRRYLIAVVMLFLIPTMLYAQSSPLPQDPNLDKPVTLAVKGEELPDIAASLAKQTGAKLRINKNLPLVKATIFVDKTPLRDVMMGLETLFRFRWSAVKKDGSNYYEFWEPLKTREERLTSLNNAYDEAWNKLDSRLRFIAGYASKSQDELKAIRAKIDEKMKPLSQSQPGVSAALTPEERSMSQIIIPSYYNPGTVSVIYSEPSLFYNRFPTEILHALKSGYTICFDSNSPEQQWRIPADITMLLNERYRVNGDSRYSMKFYIKQTDKKCVMHVDMRMSNSGTGRAGYEIGDDQNITEQVIPDYLPHAEFPGVITKNLGIKVDEIREETGTSPQSNSISAYANKSDILELIHKKIGIQIIADHYSLWSDYFPNTLDSSSAIDLLKYDRIPQRYCGWDGNFFYMRTAASHSLNNTEIPNKLIRRWQDVFAWQGYLGLQELTEIAASLSDEQIDALRKNSVYLKIAEVSDEAVNPSLWIMSDNAWIYALRLYNSLSDKQKQQAFSGGVSLTSFNAEQRAALASYLSFANLPNESLNDELNYPVGIYKNGVRIDKPGPVMMLDSVTFAMEARNPYVFIDSNGGYHSLWGKSIDEALKLLRELNESRQKSNLPVAPISKGKLHLNFGIKAGLRLPGDPGTVRYLQLTQIDILGEPVPLPGTEQP